MRWEKDETWKVTQLIDVAAEGDTRRWTIRYEYPDKRSLSILGPVVRVNWCISDELEDELIAKGEPVPKPVLGYALVDTGAMDTCLSEPVVAALNLPQSGESNHHGAHGEAPLPMYQAHLVLAFQAPDGQRTAIEKRGRFAALRKLDEYFDQFRPRDTGGGTPHALWRHRAGHPAVHDADV